MRWQSASRQGLDPRCVRYSAPEPYVARKVSSATRRLVLVADVCVRLGEAVPGQPCRDVDGGHETCPSANNPTHPRVWSQISHNPLCCPSCRKNRPTMLAIYVALLVILKTRLCSLIVPVADAPATQSFVNGSRQSQASLPSSQYKVNSRQTP